ncbi:MAG: hypothetical protein H7338_14720 [Candidatus Sericytochromatia bacterium]|nr:hypothetical protein [Candidatus Sericytochromatia bacterium]
MQIIHAQADRTLLSDAKEPISLNELATLVRDHSEFQVHDATGKDVTNRYLAELFVREDLDTKQAMFKRYILEGLLRESNKVESLVKKLLWAGIGAASVTGEKLDALLADLASRGEAGQDEYALQMRQWLTQAEALPQRVQAKVESVFNRSRQVSAAAGELSELTAKVDALTELVGQLRADRKQDERTAKKVVSVN